MSPQFDFYTILSNASKGLEGALVSLNIITNPSSVKVATGTEKQSEKSNSTDLNTPRNSSTPSDPEHTHRSISNSSSASSSQNKLSQPTSNHSTPESLHNPDVRHVRQVSSARRANSMPGSKVPSWTPSRVGTYPHSSQNTSQSANLHPASLKPMTNSSQQNQSQKPLTGQGARDAVLIRGGIRPTRYQSSDATKAKEQNLEIIGKKLAKLEFELFQNNIRKGNLNIVKNSPEFGSHNSRRTKEYRDEGLNIQKNINTLNESLLKFYTKEERAKVYTSKNTELQRLKNTPSLSPSAPLVATQPSRGHLPRT